MDEIASNECKAVEKDLYIEGHKLTICTNYEHDYGWSLYVENEKGLRTNWHEFFSSVDEAINTALKAINEEGVDEFLGNEEFGYLYDDNNK